MFWVLFTAKANGHGTEDAMIYTQVRFLATTACTGSHVAFCCPTASISAGCESTGDAATVTAATTAAFDEPTATHATAAHGPRDKRNAARTTIYA